MKEFWYIILLQVLVENGNKIILVNIVLQQIIFRNTSLGTLRLKLKDIYLVTIRNGLTFFAFA